MNTPITFASSQAYLALPARWWGAGGRRPAAVDSDAASGRDRLRFSAVGALRRELAPVDGAAGGVRDHEIRWVASSSSELEYAPIVRRLRELANLPPDWDSYGAHPPHPAALLGALRLGQRVMEVPWIAGDQTRPASISPLPSGGVEVEWEGPVERIAVEISPTGAFGYLRKKGSGRTARYQEGTGLTEKELLPQVIEVLAPLS